MNLNDVHDVGYSKIPEATVLTENVMQTIFIKVWEKGSELAALDSLLLIYG